MNTKKGQLFLQKRKYLFLVILLATGILSGILFIFFLSKEDKSLVKQELELFFTNISTHKLNYFSSFQNSFFSNSLSFFLVWLLGISIIGIPIILFLLFLKGFIFGFSLSAMIQYYGIRGIFLSFGYQFPHQVLCILLFLLLCFYAINFSIRIGKVLFQKEHVNLHLYFKKYCKIFLICIIGILVCSIIEVFLSPIVMNLFL